MIVVIHGASRQFESRKLQVKLSHEVVT